MSNKKPKPPVDGSEHDDDLPQDMLDNMKPAMDNPKIQMFVEARQRGKQKAPTKELISIRLFPIALTHFRSQGAGWQSKIDDLLVKHVEEVESE